MCAPAFAWGPDGHVIVANIAQGRLTPAAQAKVSAMLGGASLASVSNWADEIRPERRETSRWHFINFAEGATHYVPSRDCVFIEGQGDRIIAAIDRVLADLKRSDTSRIDALKFLAHFVGDLHQPFHAIATERRESGIRVSFFDKRTNLHAVWDSGLIAHATNTRGLHNLSRKDMALRKRHANTLTRHDSRMGTCIAQARRKRFGPAGERAREYLLQDVCTRH